MLRAGGLDDVAGLFLFSIDFLCIPGEGEECLKQQGAPVLFLGSQSKTKA